MLKIPPYIEAAQRRAFTANLVPPTSKHGAHRVCPNSPNLMSFFLSLPPLSTNIPCRRGFRSCRISYPQSKQLSLLEADNKTIGQVSAMQMHFVPKLMSILEIIARNP